MAPADIHRVRVRYEGEVQGVGFRATTARLARGFPVGGWVRNERDGSVLLEAEGTPESVRAFLAAIRGSGLGPGIRAERREGTGPCENAKSFEIRYW